MYECILCEYKTEYSSNFSIHKKTTKHINNLNTKSTTRDENTSKKHSSVNSKPIVVNSSPIEVKKLICKKCNFTTLHKSSLSRHYKSCNVKKESDNNNRKSSSRRDKWFLASTWNYKVSFE
jgi:hypothetical protein